ncbi:MAG: tol-pal system protein YbgF [Xanthomonadaceae bacterium]|jgi:tol-pal system protein YbgF|nr:tol-pal system protein YbgF [Xanthomonadaceae bacterium]
MRFGLLPILVAATFVVAAPAGAQRMSLADRVAQLEARAADNQGNTDILNQLDQLRAEVQSLRASLEQLQNENQQLKKSSQDQYLDLDSRLNRLEGGGQPPAASAPSAAASAPMPSTVASSTASAASASAAPRVYGDSSAVANAADERSAYNVAFEALKAGQYVDSADLFQNFLGVYPNGVYAPNALYWLGESYYVTENYHLAEQQFRELIARYPTHDKTPGALLKVGLSQYGEGNAQDAATTLNQVIQQYPDSDAARIASDRLQSIQMSR